eukprot:m.1019512 g.1019512  ORF g.1019512 m.1019512 type:complete len:67 (+) comp24087_c0_seq18:1-201(+)
MVCHAPPAAATPPQPRSATALNITHTRRHDTKMQQWRQTKAGCTQPPMGVRAYERYTRNHTLTACA